MARADTRRKKMAKSRQELAIMADELEARLEALPVRGWDDRFNSSWAREGRRMLNTLRKEKAPVVIKMNGRKGAR